MVTGLSTWWVLAGVGVWMLALAFVVILFTAARRADSYEAPFRRLVLGVIQLSRLRSPSGRPFFTSDSQPRELARDIHDLEGTATGPRE
jgi:hypothetical protein